MAPKVHSAAVLTRARTPNTTKVTTTAIAGRSQPFDLWWALGMISIIKMQRKALQHHWSLEDNAGE